MDTSWTLCGSHHDNWQELSNFQEPTNETLDLGLWGTTEFQFDDSDSLTANSAAKPRPASSILQSVSASVPVEQVVSPSNAVNVHNQNFVETARSTKRDAYREDVRDIILEIPGASPQNALHILESLRLVDTCSQCNNAPLAHCEHGSGDLFDIACEPFVTELGEHQPAFGVQKKRGRRKLAEETLTAEQRDKRRRNNAASARFRARKKLRDVALERVARSMIEKSMALETELESLRKELDSLKKNSNYRLA